MGKLDVHINKTSEKLSLKMSGTIDEDVDFQQYSLSGANLIDLDLNGVSSINSCGIREWIKWISTGSSAKITFNNCPKVIVDQINMVDGFLPGNATVTSFFVPYYNEELGSEKNILFRWGHEFKEGSVTPPSVVKDDSGEAMEMDVIESKYFKFIKK